MGWLVKTNPYGCIVPGCQFGDNPVDAEPKDTSIMNPPLPEEPITMLYPNPATESIFYYHHQDSFNFGTVYIYNSAGQRVHKWDIKVNDITYEIDISNFAAGQYILQVLVYRENPESIKNIVSNLISEKVDLLNSKLYLINPLCIELNQYNNTTQPIDPSKRICIISGLNISMQKKGSFLLSITGLKYYFNTDKKIYNEIKRQYLTDKWLNSSFDIQIKEIAHNIRTIRNNQKNKQSRLYPIYQYNLFHKELQI